MNQHTLPSYAIFLNHVPPFTEKMERTGMLNLLHALGNFHEHLAVIHIAGTNGKGSSSYMLDTIYRGHGYTVGMFISPYIDDYRECIYINGQQISITAMNTATETVEKAYLHLKKEHKQLPTQYECLTCIGLYAMYTEKVDLAIVETLMGGRDDATNVFSKILAALITSIGYDHTEFLGNSLIEIASHKSGIAKSNSPIFVNSNPDEVIDTIQKYANSIQASFHVSDHYLSQKNININNYLPLPLNGQHQIQNFSGVLSVLNHLSPLYPIDFHRIPSLLSRLQPPCRIETFSINGHNITLDGSHNNEGLMALSHYLEKETTATPIILVFGSLKNKKNTLALEHLMSLSTEVIFTTAKSPRANDPRDYPFDCDRIIPDLDLCMDTILHRIHTVTTPFHFVICGSFYVAHPFRQRLKKI